MYPNFTINTKDYDIYIYKDYENLINFFTNKYSSNIRICIITDSNVGRFYLNIVNSILSKKYRTYSYIINPGEKSKSIKTFYSLHKYLLSINFTRSDILVALGGGVVGDITGFIASTYMRGIDYIQLPTSLLSQVDSSIGSKTGININNTKNIIGSFYNPSFVYINIDTLKTLDKKNMIAGYSEILKSAIIHSKKLFSNFESIQLFDIKNIISLIIQSIEIKKYYIENDFKENGIRKILNFGHTFGHALESLYFTKFNHGECVAYGMLIATRISLNRKYITYTSYKKIITQITRLINPSQFNEIDINQVILKLKFDKKNINGAINWILLNDINLPIIINDIKLKEVYDAFKQTI